MTRAHIARVRPMDTKSNDPAIVESRSSKLGPGTGVGDYGKQDRVAARQYLGPGMSGFKARSIESGNGNNGSSPGTHPEQRSPVPGEDDDVVVADRITRHVFRDRCRRPTTERDALQPVVLDENQPPAIG